MTEKNNNEKVKLWDLFLTFARIGGFTFGGGYSMLPLMTRELCDNKKWANEQELLDYYAISQCIPGIIAINTATFIGSKHRGVLGALVATTGMVTPSIVVILAIASFLQNFSDIAWIQSAFAGIRVCVGVLITNAIIKLWQSGIHDALGVLIFLFVLGLSLFTSLSPVYGILLGAACGIIYYPLKEKRRVKNK